MNSDLLYRSALDMVHLLQKRMVSSEELVRMHLNRIEEVNGKINALVTKNERAIERAVQLDKMRQNGSTMGPLHGLPMTIMMVIGSPCKGPIVLPFWRILSS